jgi:ATP-dependent Lon protease
MTGEITLRGQSCQLRLQGKNVGSSTSRAENYHPFQNEEPDRDEIPEEIPRKWYFIPLNG